GRDEPLVHRAGRSTRASGHSDVDPADTGEGRDRLPCRLPHALADWTGGRRELDRESDRAIRNPDILHESQGHDVAPQIGVGDDAECVQDLAFAYRGRISSPASWPGLRAHNK